MKRPLDVLITNTGIIHTLAGNAPRRGASLLDTGAKRNFVIGVKSDRIAFVGAEPELSASQWSVSKQTQEFDAKGGDVIPGFVDSHTHTIWLGDRLNEFADLLRGRSYADITAAGGGIATTMRGTRGATVEHLVEAARKRIDRMLTYGTTTIETKSGYALDTEGELRLLEAAAQLRDSTHMRVIPTFMGAHLVPPEFKGRPYEYVSLLCEEMIPAVAKQGIAVFCDAFLDAHAFNAVQISRVFTAAKAVGLLPRLHCDELADDGGTAFGVSEGAISCDHLEFASDAGIAAIGSSDTVATLMPGTSFYLNLPRHAPYKRLFQANAAITLATDFNPGTSPSLSMQGALALGVHLLRMPVEAALCASTINAAHSLRIADEVGSLEVGKSADILVLRSSLTDLAYHWGENHCEYVFCGGKLAAKGGCLVVN